MLAVGLLWSVSAAAEPMTAGDLAGTTIDASLVTAQTARSVKGVTSHRVTYTHKLQVEPDEKLKHTLIISTTMLDGTTRTRTWKGDTVLGKPFPWRDGHSVWILDKNSLVRLGTLTEGAAKVIITFDGSGSNLSCKIAREAAKEVGVGKITSNKTASGLKIDVLKQTDISSSCRVRKR